MAVTFENSANHFTYQIWYNQSLTSLVTDHVTDLKGQFLAQMMRGIDEAISELLVFSIFFFGVSGGLKSIPPVVAPPRPVEYSLGEIGNLPGIALNVDVKGVPLKESQGLSDTISTYAGPLFFFCAAMINFMLVLNTIVQEKELKLRHGMQVMGLIPSVYWASQFLINLAIITATTLITCLFGFFMGFPLFLNTDFSVCLSFSLSSHLF